MSSYIGRFAPSPTGPLHFGSLVAALASFLDARAHKGQWLVRIEDLDPPREDPAASSEILRILDAYGLHWDGEVVYQSQRGERYQSALDQLIAAGQAFPCSCSRRQLGNRLHSGICTPDPASDCAWRFLCPDQVLTIKDGLQPDHRYDCARDIGDFVIRRRDQLWSYQLAVVVDDAVQGITHVVRGIDLIDSTARQVLLQQALSLPQPQYSHLPVAVEENGQKLSKQNLSLAVTDSAIQSTLITALNWLQQNPPTELASSRRDEILQWACAHWQPQVLQGIRALPAPPGFLRPSYPGSHL